MRVKFTDVLIVGMALFAMFFGAGNIIFPPYLGVGAGEDWWLAFSAYFFADMGLALLAIFALLRANAIENPLGIMSRLGKIPAAIMMSAVVICIGPLLATPRTAAVSFGMGVEPFTGEGVGFSVAWSILFFAIALLFAIKESKMVDYVGKFLTPILVIFLLLIIGAGVVNPIGKMSEKVTFSSLTQPFEYDGLPPYKLTAIYMSVDKAQEIADYPLGSKADTAFEFDGFPIGQALVVPTSIQVAYNVSKVPSYYSAVFSEGIENGYQTMDVLAALMFGLIIIRALRGKGYTTEKSQMTSVCLAGGICAFLMLLVYGGLAYLGATGSEVYDIHRDSSTQIVLGLTRDVFGHAGGIILAIAVICACLTTAIGLVGSAGTFFSSLSNGALKYNHIVIFVCVFCAIFSNIGLSAIIAIAVPILTVVYPGALVVVVLSLFNNQIKNDNVFKLGTIGAVLVSILEVLNGWNAPFGFITLLPLSAYGYGWVVPAIICSFLGALIPSKKLKLQRA